MFCSVARAGVREGVRHTHIHTRMLEGWRAEGIVDGGSAACWGRETTLGGVWTEGKSALDKRDLAAPGILIFTSRNP